MTKTKQTKKEKNTSRSRSLPTIRNSAPPACVWFYNNMKCHNKMTHNLLSCSAFYYSVVTRNHTEFWIPFFILWLFVLLVRSFYLGADWSRSSAARNGTTSFYDIFIYFFRWRAGVFSSSCDAIKYDLRGVGVAGRFRHDHETI